MFDIPVPRRRCLPLLLLTGLLITIVVTLFKSQSDSLHQYIFSSASPDGSAAAHVADEEIKAVEPETVTVKEIEHVTETVTATATATATPVGPDDDNYNDHCDPFNEPGYFDVQNHLSVYTKYVSLNPKCKTKADHIWTRLVQNETIPELQDKTVVIIGDSVDRNLVTFLCDKAKGTIRPTYQEDHNHEWNRSSGREVPHCFPRVCTLPFYNLTIVNYFMYGLDEQGIWNDRKDIFWAPYTWRERVQMFGKTFATLGRGPAPHTLVFNSGLWDLARYDRLGMKAGDNETISYNATIVNEYATGLGEFTQMLGEMFPSAQLVYREPHHPRIKPKGQFTGGDKPRVYRYAAHKVDQFNEVARNVVARTPGAQFWPIGRLTRGLRRRDILGDDVHPSGMAQEMLWGPGLFEYVIRGGRVRQSAE